MIKKREDNTQRVHKLRPRYTGPYKITQEFTQNVEVIPWMHDRKVKLIDKYKNEAKQIPKFEKYIIGKDLIKPCSNLSFYYDESLARRFYTEFWDLIKDVQPVKEVERYVHPTEYEHLKPKGRPSSLLLPARIGIPKNLRHKLQGPRLPDKHKNILNQTEYSSVSSRNEKDLALNNEGHLIEEETYHNSQPSSEQSEQSDNGNNDDNNNDEGDDFPDDDDHWDLIFSPTPWSDGGLPKILSSWKGYSE